MGPSVLLGVSVLRLALLISIDISTSALVGGVASLVAAVITVKVKEVMEGASVGGGADVTVTVTAGDDWALTMTALRAMTNRSTKLIIPIFVENWRIISFSCNKFFDN
jgi:hypothetical protein